VAFASIPRDARAFNTLRAIACQVKHILFAACAGDIPPWKQVPLEPTVQRGRQRGNMIFFWLIPVALVVIIAFVVLIRKMARDKPE
jgi:hypothetical protein